ncbi:hypothetical protein C5167_011832, partial [Papaver somniferum]
ENGDCKGVRLASGQEVLSQHLVINPSVTGPSPPFLPRAPNLPEECSESDDKGEVIEKVARLDREDTPDWNLDYRNILESSEKA